jgi:hypothetical protein
VLEREFNPWKYRSEMRLDLGLGAERFSVSPNDDAAERQPGEPSARPG